MSLTRPFLRAASLFEGLDDAVIDDLARSAQVVSLDVGKPFQRAGQPGPGAALLLEGRLRRIWNPPGREPSSLGGIDAQQWAGLATVLRGEPDLTLIASRPCRMVLIAREAMQAVLAAHPDLRQRLHRPLFEELAVLLLPSLERQGRHVADPAELVERLLPEVRLVPVDESLPPEHWLCFSGPAAAGWPAPGSLLSSGECLAPKAPGIQPRILALSDAALAGALEDGTRILAAGTEAAEVHGTPGALSESPSAPPLTLRQPEATSLAPLGQQPGGRSGAGGFKGGADTRVEQALTCIVHLAAARRIAFSSDQIRRNLEDVERRLGALRLPQVGLQLEALGFDTRPLRARAWDVTRLEPPALLDLDGSFVLLLVAGGGGGVLVGDPRQGLRRIGIRQLEELMPDGVDLLIIREGRTERSEDDGFGLGWFLPAFLRFPGLLAMTLFTAFASQLLSTAFPLGVLAVIDQVIANNNPSLLAPLTAVLAVAAAASSVLSVMRALITADLSDRVDVRLGSSVVEHLMRLPLPYFEQRQVGLILYNVNQLYNLRQFVVDQLLGVGLDVLFAVLFLLLLFWLSPTLTLIVVVVAPLLMLINAIASPVLIRLIRRINRASAQAGAYLYEVVSGMRTVKSQNFEVEARWNWLERYRRYTNARYRLTQVGSLISEGGQLISKVSDIALIVVGASLILANQITLGTLFAVKILSSQVIGPLLRLSGLWQAFQEMRLSLACLGDVMLAIPEVGVEDLQCPPLPGLRGAIRFEEVSFRYGSRGRLVLDQLDLSIDPGQFVGIVGLSGSGKSTMVQLIDRLYLPKQGQVYLDGIDIAKVQLASLRRRIGYVPQDSLLFEGTVLDNIRLNNPDATIEAVTDAAIVAGAHDFILKLENGYATWLGERGSGLSGGQRQRICLARTVLQDPSLLILDEATSALDAETERLVCRNLARRFAGTTVLFITHRLTTLQSADRILFMERGRIVEDGTHAELIARRGAYATLYEQQVGAP